MNDRGQTIHVNYWKQLPELQKKNERRSEERIRKKRENYKIKMKYIY